MQTGGGVGFSGRKVRHYPQQLAINPRHARSSTPATNGGGGVCVGRPGAVGPGLGGFPRTPYTGKLFVHSCIALVRCAWDYPYIEFQFMSPETSTICDNERYKSTKLVPPVLPPPAQH